ncbi:MAG: hypothetical protein L0216_00255 [Planctomycetales bacterium]|nr:hypothetical protein [Planctomycetales bacterium]
MSVYDQKQSYETRSKSGSYLAWVASRVFWSLLTVGLILGVLHMLAGMGYGWARDWDLLGQYVLK